MANQFITIHAFVSGKVQGVYYRDTIQRKAQSENITGWVKNLSDGRVEVMATGHLSVLPNFVNGLWEGSSASKVEDVIWRQAPYTEFSEFVIKR